MAHPLNMKQRLRVDVITEENHRELYQKNAVEFEEGFYKVPKVID
jgi:aspartyl-tRNA(Asn)/glutamyl-tRNA(Gln) amidotransferase subunit C